MILQSYDPLEHVLNWGNEPCSLSAIDGAFLTCSAYWSLAKTSTRSAGSSETSILILLHAGQIFIYFLYVTLSFCLILLITYNLLIDHCVCICICLREPGFIKALRETEMTCLLQTSFSPHYNILTPHFFMYLGLSIAEKPDKSRWLTPSHSSLRAHRKQQGTEESSWSYNSTKQQPEDVKLALNLC